MNPLASLLWATEGYRLSKPIEVKVTNLLYIDDLKVFAASEGKLNRVLKETKGATGIRKSALSEIGYQVESDKCRLCGETVENVTHIVRGYKMLAQKDYK